MKNSKTKYHDKGTDVERRIVCFLIIYISYHIYFLLSIDKSHKYSYCLFDIFV